MNTPALRQMELTDLQIKACTVWRAPDKVVYLELPYVSPLFQFVAGGAFIDDLELGTPSEFPFLCKVVSFTGVTPGTLVQIQWPDGRYLSNPGVDMFSFVGTGRRGRLIRPHKLMDPASKIRFNIDNRGAGDTNLELYFEGVLRVPLMVGT